jgi:hypothetical protein
MTSFVEIFQLIRKLKWGEIQELCRHADAKTGRQYNQQKDIDRQFCLVAGRIRCADCTSAHQHGSQSITCTFYVHHSTESNSRQQFSTSNISRPLLFYHLTAILTKTIRFLTVNWSRNIFVFLSSSSWRWPNERPKHTGDHNAIKSLS